MQENGNKKNERHKIYFLLFYFIITLLCIVFAVLCVYESANTFILQNAKAFSALASVSLIMFALISSVCLLKDRKKIGKLFLILYITLFLGLIFLFILQKTNFFEVVGSATLLESYLEKTGALMPIFYILLQYLQVVILPIPSIVSTVAGVALFGALKATTFSFIGIVLGSLSAFFIGRKLGFKAAVWLVGEESLRKWQRKLKGKDEIFLSLMFLLPLFPDDILCFLAGLSTMSNGYFIALILISRFFAIACTCYSVDFIPLNTWWGIAVWGVFILIIAATFVLVYKNLSKIQKFFSRRFKSLRKSRK